MNIKFDEISKLAHALNDIRPDAAMVMNPADLSDVAAHCADLAKYDNVLGALDSFYGVKVFSHVYLPKGEYLAVDTVERALKVLEELDKAAEICRYHASLPMRNDAGIAMARDIETSCLATAGRIRRGEYENPTSAVMQSEKVDDPECVCGGIAPFHYNKCPSYKPATKNEGAAKTPVEMPDHVITCSCKGCREYFGTAKDSGFRAIKTGELDHNGEP